MSKEGETTSPEVESKIGHSSRLFEMLIKKADSVENEAFSGEKLNPDVDQLSSLESTKIDSRTAEENGIASLREQAHNLELQIENLKRRIKQAEIERLHTVAHVDAQRCQGCGVCGDVCPVDAIEVNDIAVIDANTCMGCGACVTQCPFDAISMN